MLSGVAMLSWLTRPDAEQLALDSSSLRALAKLTAIANSSGLSAEEDDKSLGPSRLEIVASEINMLEDLASLPPSTGKRPYIVPDLIAL